MTDLTARQERVLAFLREYAVGHGYPPTIREIREAFGLRSNRGVVDHLRALERKGRIRRSPGSSRAIEIVGRDDTVEAGRAKARRYPLAGRIPAGRPEAPAETAGDSFLLDERLFAERGDFILEVKGESMTGEHIVPGDFVVVRKTASCESGSLVVALVDGEATVKRFSRKGRRVLLEPANPDYEPIDLSEGVGREAAVIGEVVGVIRRFPKRRGAFSR